jgi:FtsP/CotA-like multicopper oxidase with cupredoxin domain
VSHRDRAIGVVLGLVLGLATVTLFVFFGSGSSIDAPRLSEGGSATTTTTTTKPVKPKVQTVGIVGGGPAGTIPNIKAKPGARVRFRVTSDLTEAVEVHGYGITKTVPAGQAVTFEFKARKRGEFPVLVQATHIGVARLIVGPVRVAPGPGIPPRGG